MDQIKGFKCRQLAEELRQKIVSGEYAFGSRLPGSQVLSSLYNASYVTVYKALLQLEQEGYITMKKRVGSIVSFIRDAPSPTQKRLNLITTDLPFPVFQDFLEAGREIFTKAGWDIQTFLLPETSTLPDKALLAVNSPDAYTLVWGINSVFQNMLASLDHFYDRTIYVGEYLTDLRLTCVTCDEPTTMRIALEHFRANGRTRTAIFRYFLDSLTESHRISAWQSDMMAHGASYRWCLDHTFKCTPQRSVDDNSWMDEAFEALLRSGRLAEIDSIFIAFEPHAVRFEQLCRQHGIAIPDDISVITLGNNTCINQASPPLSYIDNRMEHHLRLALEILENRLQGISSSQRLFTFQPTLKPAASSLPPPAVRQSTNRR